MPRQIAQPFPFSGPWGGLNDIVSPKHLGFGDLSAASNVVNKAGRIAPRPGREFVKEVAFAQEDNGRIVTGETDIRGIAVDTTNDKVYWSDDGTKVRRSNLDGSSAEDVITGLTTPRQIALDPANGHVYVADQGAGTIVRADITSVPDSNKTTLQSSQTNVSALAIDTVSATPRIYWNSNNTGFKRATLGVSDTPETISSLSISFAQVKIALDTSNQHLYCTRGNAISRIDMADGANETTFTASSATIQGLAIATDTGHLYWTDLSADAVYRSNLAGTRQEQVINTQLYDPYAIAIDASGSTNYAYISTKAGSSPGNNTDIFKANVGNVGTIVSAYQWDRQIHDVDQSVSEFTKDIVVLQYINSDESASGYAAWLRDTNEVFVLLTGYEAAALGRPNIFAVDTRSGNSKSSGIQFGDTSGRASFAAMGEGINTGKGGVLVADGSGAYVLNYVLGDAVWTAEITGSPTGGTFTLDYGSEETANIAYNASADDMRDALESLSAIDQVVVTKSGSTFTIRFTGAWSGKDSDTLALNDNSLTGGTAPDVDVNQTQAGGTDTDATLYLRPTGLLRPATPSIAASSSGSLTDGQYRYRVTWYSATWDIESPPSEASNYAGSNGSEKITVTWAGSLPDNEYFWHPGSSTAIANGPLVSHVRIYRRREGTDGGGSTPPDGTNADSNWFFIAQKPAADLSYEDTGDTLDTTSPVPFQNEYPPANANYVEVINERAIYNSGRDMYLWHSELPKRGGISNAELGFEYVANESFSVPSPKRQSDATITGLKAFGGLLYAGTQREVIAVGYDNVEALGTATFQYLPGTLGFASHWCVTEVAELPNSTGALFWVNPNGYCYLFDGVTTRPANLQIRNVANGLHRRYWHDKDYFPSTLSGWYWASVVNDPQNNRIILSVFEDDDTHVNLCYDIDTQSWSQWDIGGYGWLLARDPDTADPQLLFGLEGSEIHKLADGKGDDGSTFPYSYSTGRYQLGGATNPTKMGETVFGFDLNSFGGDDAVVTVTASLNDGKANVANAGQTVDSNSDYTASVNTANTGVRNALYTISGTQADDQTHAELISMTSDIRTTGMPRQ